MGSLDSGANAEDETQSWQSQIGYARMLISRLERLSADSYWAHRSSGLRGSLLRALERVESAPGDPDRSVGDLRALDELIQQGFSILEKAAREIKGDEAKVKRPGG